MEDDEVGVLGPGLVFYQKPCSKLSLFRNIFFFYIQVKYRDVWHTTKTEDSSDGV